MITIKDIRKVNYNVYDKVLSIVRSLKNPGKMKHIPELSLSWNLFKKYLQLQDSGWWSTETFRNIYVPTFLREMQTAAARKKLNELVWLDRHGGRIALACFCPDEEKCHRSIVAGILQHVEIQVQVVKGDYSQYGRAYEQLIKH